MITDLGDIESGALIEADLCIVGAGAAGITIAREFAGSKVRVVLVESGGLESDDSTQALYEGRNIGTPYYGLDTCRLRYFGGTTNHWAGTCAPLDTIDFEARPWVPHSGWPLAKSDLEPLYKRAHAVLGLGSYVYDERIWRTLGFHAPRLDPDRVRIRFWRILAQPTRFGKLYRDDLAKAQNIRVLLHANVTNFDTDAQGTAVTQLDVQTLAGNKARIKARACVIACGGIENARLLLLSNRVEISGLGNRHDLVGRYFMEHLQARCGVIRAADPYKLLERYRLHHKGTLTYWAALKTSTKIQRQQKVLNSASEVSYVPDSRSGTKAMREIWDDLKRGAWSDDLGDKVWRVVTDLDDVANSAYRRIAKGKEPIAAPKEVYLFSRGEQTPNPESRVTLSDQRDSLGLRRVELAWRLTDLDRRSLSAMTMAIGVEFARLKLGRVRMEDWLTAKTYSWPDDLQGGNHHMGTTRMAIDPKQGVVDKDCRVHGIENLFIAGSSVFPTSGGHSNPTLTIVALALRLADHLKSRFA